MKPIYSMLHLLLKLFFSFFVLDLSCYLATGSIYSGDWTPNIQAFSSVSFFILSLTIVWNHEDVMVDSNNQ